MQKRLLCHLTSLAISCSPLLLTTSAHAIDGTAGVAKTRTPLSPTTRKTKQELREEFYEFVGKLFDWTAYYISLRHDENEPVTELYFRLPDDMKARFAHMFEQYRDVLVALGRFTDLNLVQNIEVIPNSVYEFMRGRFAIADHNSPLDRNDLLLKLIGGDFNFGDGKKVKINGFITSIAELDMPQWAPVREFIRNFEATLAMDSRLSQQMGTSMLPLIKHYYRYMDPISRLRLLKELADDMKTHPPGERSYNDTLDSVTVKVFQNSGPVMIKLLQQLQEEVNGDSPMTKVLAELKSSKPMSIKKAELLARAELTRMTGERQLTDFEFIKKPLGMASIAQTHRFKYKGRQYVVKLQKERVDEVYKREKAFLLELVTKEPDFDKGMKQKIANTCAGIDEEIDFNYERRNLEAGKLAYTDPANSIFTVDIPQLGGSRTVGNPKVFVMTLAKGEPVGKIMERREPTELIDTYKAVQALYKKFLMRALDPSEPPNFYHGDLHRENMFYDLVEAQTMMIDFGNAGVLTPFMRDSILNILNQAKETETDDETAQEEAILGLGKVLLEFVLEHDKVRMAKSESTPSLMRSYFDVCFNPGATIADKNLESQDLARKKEQLETLLHRVQALIKNNVPGVDKGTVDVIQDDIDIIKALMGNCLNGPANPLLSALASKELISDKLTRVFQELLRNGIAMPKEVIFFVKSKGLLEGILNNLATLIEENHGKLEYVEPDDIYKGVLQQINAKSGKGRAGSKAKGATGMQSAGGSLSASEPGTKGGLPRKPSDHSLQSAPGGGR